jgi:hypothetical protein
MAGSIRLLGAATSGRMVIGRRTPEKGSKPFGFYFSRLFGSGKARGRAGAVAYRGYRCWSRFSAARQLTVSFCLRFWCKVRLWGGWRLNISLEKANRRPNSEITRMERWTDAARNIFPAGFIFIGGGGLRAG